MITLKNTQLTDLSVITTTDLSVFKPLDSNREISALHVRCLAESMRERILYAPLYVNEEMEILDGQHRLAALQLLEKEGLPVKVTFIKFKDKTYDASVLGAYNTNASNWNISDFIASHMKRGNEEVMVVDTFFKHASVLSKSICMYILVDDNDLKPLKNGTIKVSKKQYDTAFELFNSLLELKDLNISFWKDPKFIKAYTKLFKQELFVKDDFMNEVKKNLKKLIVRDKVGDYISDLSSIYSI